MSVENAELILGREKQVAGDLFEVGLHICFVVHDAAFNFRQHVEVQFPGTGFGGLVLLFVAIRGLLYTQTESFTRKRYQHWYSLFQ